MTEHLQAQLTAQAADIEHLQRTLNELTGQADNPGDGGGEGDEATLLFDELTDFVDGFVATVYERPSHMAGDIKWFDCWTNHPSALWVMEVLWGSFEEARAADIEEGGGSNSAGWMVSTFIPLMEWITDNTGPMGLCSTTRCEGAGLLGQPRHYPAGVSA